MFLRSKFFSRNKNKITEIIADGNEFTNDNDIARIFNDHFTNIGVNIAQNVPDNNINPLDYLKGNYTRSFHLFDTTAEEVFKTIQGLKDKKCNTLNQIPVKVLKFIAKEKY